MGGGATVPGGFVDMKYPGGNGGQIGETVTTAYDKWGLPSTLNGTNPYVVGTDYNALGQVELLKLGNTAADPTLQTDYIYFGASGNFRLQWIKTGPTSPFEGHQKMEYAYDSVGNVLTIKDYKAGGTQTQTFTYDHLDRILTASASGGTGGTYSEIYEYALDPGKIGNLTKKGANNYTYGAQSAACPDGALSKPHAVVTAGSNTYCYDRNGNMVKRNSGSFTLAYDSENRLTTVSGGASATFVYDGDGNLVKKRLGTANTSYVGNHFEWTGSTSTMVKYYYHDGKRVAMRVGTSTWYFLLTDHLASTSVTATSAGSKLAELRYKAWGENRYSSGTTPTTYRFTGQREESTIALYFYNARWYDAALGRFAQADTIVPEPGNPQALNRYAYTLNNPVRYTDPSGHIPYADPSGRQGCAPGDQACWENNWYWKNRWYSAHGYFWGGNHWSVAGDPYFQDEGITDEVIAGAGISLASTVSPSPWSWGNKRKVAYAVAKFGQKLASGIAGLKALLGGQATIKLNPKIAFYCTTGACAPPWTGGHDILFTIGRFGAADLVSGAQLVVHELAHVIDWQNNFSPRWSFDPLTEYAATRGVPPVYPGRWEKWAEAVTVYVFPDYKINEPGRQQFDLVALQVQMECGRCWKVGIEMGTKSFATFLLALAALLAISCTSRIQATIDCRELSLMENLQAKLSRPTGLEELHYWIGQTYNLGLKDVEVAEYEGLVSLRWQTDGATYALTVQDSVPHDARIGFVANEPSFSEVLKCLGWGAPDYYWAFFGDEIPYGRTYTVALYFLGEGVFVASGKHFLTNRDVEPPPLNANLPVSVVVLVKPGSIEEVYSQVNHGISLESRAPAHRPRPWPGSWASLEYVERLWGNK